MACLDRLPSEVLTRVVENLVAGPNEVRGLYSASAISSLSKSSHFYRAICEPYLYKNIDISNEEDVLFLVRTLVQRPEIARLVHHLDITGWGRSQKTRLPDEDILYSTRTVLRQLAASPSKEERWRAHLLAQSGQASTAVLIALLPELVDLSISIRRSSEHVTSILQTAVQEQQLVSATVAGENAPFNPQDMRWPPLLGNLSTLSIVGSPDVAMELGQILQLKTLKTLEINSSSAPGFGAPYIDQRSRIEHLYITDCHMDEDNIQSILVPCTALRTFKYQRPEKFHDIYDIEGEWHEDSNYAYNWIDNGLRESQQTLEVLELSGPPVIPSSTTTFNSLANYNCLRRLQAPARILLVPNGVSPGRRILCMLPKTLTSLEIFTAGVPEEASLALELVDFVRHVDRSPKIAELILVWQPMRGSRKKKDIGIFQELNEACIERAIVFRIP